MKALPPQALPRCHSPRAAVPCFVRALSIRVGVGVCASILFVCARCGPGREMGVVHFRTFFCKYEDVHHKTVEGLLQLLETERCARLAALVPCADSHGSM